MRQQLRLGSARPSRRTFWVGPRISVSSTCTATPHASTPLRYTPAAKQPAACLSGHPASLGCPWAWATSSPLVLSRRAAPTPSAARADKAARGGQPGGCRAAPLTNQARAAGPLLRAHDVRPSTGQGRGSGGRGAGILVLAAIYLRVMGRRPCLCPCPGFVPYLLECWIPPAAPLHNHVFRVRVFSWEKEGSGKGGVLARRFLSVW